MKFKVMSKAYKESKSHSQSKSKIEFSQRNKTMDLVDILSKLKDEHPIPEEGT